MLPFTIICLILSQSLVIKTGSLYCDMVLRGIYIESEMFAIISISINLWKHIFFNIINNIN